MFRRILFPTDCSERARSLVALIAGMEPAPEHVCAAVVVTISGMEQPLVESHLEQAKRDIDELVAPLVDAGVETDTHVLTGRAVREILRAGEACGSDSIVLGSYGKNPMEEVLKGSLSAELTRQATLPVLSIRFGALWEKPAEECERIGRGLLSRPLHPTDFSACSERALDTLAEEAVSSVDHVDLVHIVDDVYQADGAHEREVQEAREQLGKAAESLQRQGVSARTHLIEGDPVADILRLSCELDSSVLVLGSHGKGLVREAVVGSVSQELMRLASKPVLVVH